jgi:MoaA/NifB/PqqE/SkfB family radical SAM enzyme
MWIAGAVGTGLRLIAAIARGRGVPFQVTLSVTNRCNKTCAYCSIPNLAVPEMGTDEWRTIMNRLREAGTRRVLFFGGEPLLREDILELVTHARSLGLRAGMTTNGSLVPQRADVIRQLDSLAVSLDGSPDSHDRIRGKGSHEQALRAVEVAMEYRVPVKVNAVLCADNGKDLEWLLDFSDKRGLPLVLNILRSEETGLHRDAARHRLDNESVRELLDTVARVRRDHPQIFFSRYTYETVRKWPDYTLDRLTRRQHLKAAGPPCSAGRFHGFVSAEGRLYPCVLTAGLVPALNILQDGLGAAMAQAASHDCIACSSPCMVEINAAFALHPRVIARHLSAFFRKRRIN